MTIWLNGVNPTLFHVADDLEAEAKAKAAQLEAEYPQDRVAKLVAAGGLAE
jgi:hypothetical protein